MTGVAGGRGASTAGAPDRTGTGLVTLAAVVGAAGILLLFLAPGDLGKEVVQVLTGYAAAALVAVGIRRNRPARPGAWWLVAAGIALLATGDLVYVLIEHATGPLEGTSPADVPYLLAYPALAAGLWMMARLQRGGRWEDLIDSSILVLAAGSVIWRLVAAPHVWGEGAVGDQAVAAAYLLLDVALLVPLSRLVVRAGLRVPATLLLVASVLATTVGDLTFASMGESYTWPGPTDALLLAGTVLAGIAALHPSMVRLTEPAEIPPEVEQRYSLAVLAIALLLLPVGRLLEDLVGTDTTGPSMVIVAVVVVALIVARAYGLVAELTQARGSQAAVERRFVSLVENASDVIGVIEPDGTISYVSASVEEMLGYPASEIEGRGAFELVHPDDRRRLADAATAIEGEPGADVRVEVRNRAADGTWRWIEARVTNRLDDPDVAGYVINERDVTERRHAEEALRDQALHDALTGLPNRSLFIDRLEQALARSRRTGRGLAVLFLDLDQFKLVNDSLGHETGDRLLVEVAERLVGALRPGDTVARFGGDEFTVLCEEVDNLRDGRLVAGRAAGALEQPFGLDGVELRVTASIGIALASGPDHSPDGLLRDADAAMYRAKEQGRARTEVFDATLRDRAVSRLHTTTDLQRALQADELVLHYQPVFDLGTGAATVVEALVRWEHPSRGLLGPGAFIPVAEDSGLIDQVGAWVLERGVQEAVSWAERGVDVPVAINVSPLQLVLPSLAEVVADVLSTSGLPAQRLCLELTETVLAHDLSSVVDVLRALSDMGVTLAVDDFGTGYSSLAYVKDLPIDVLKIDRSFVAGLPEDDRDAAIIETIVALAHRLDLVVIAEGVERPEQVSALAALGCDQAQGYLFARPAPAEQVLARLADPATRPVPPATGDGGGSGTRRAAARPDPRTTATTAPS